MLERAVSLLPLSEPENPAARADQEENLSPEKAEQTSKHNLISAFKPSGAITLFSYLTPITDRVDWYRAIMRIFLQRSREYRYQLTAQDVLDTLHTSHAHS